MPQCPGGPARSEGASRRTTASGGASTTGIVTRTASGVMAGRSSDGTDAVPAGSFAAESTAQQRCGLLGGRGFDGQCARQQVIARSSAMEARGAATVMRAVMPTARTSTQVVSRFRDTERHCMSDANE